MYGLKQAGMLAHADLKTHLVPYGYSPLRHTPGLWKHESNSVVFSLVVDDFGVKYTNAKHAQHLLNALSQKYDITTDWSGSLYCGLAIEWDYTNKTVNISMPHYAEQVLAQHQHPHPKRLVHSQSTWIAPTYHTKGPHLTPPLDHSKPLTPTQSKQLQ